MPTGIVSSTYKLIIGLVVGIAANTTLLAATPKIDATALTIIGYHEITDRKDALIPSYAVTSQQFSEHLDR